MEFWVAISILKMKEKSNLSGILCFITLRKVKNATEMPKKICAEYGKAAEADQTCQNWFAMFRAGGILLDDAPWSGRPAEVDSDQIKVLRMINVIPCGG